MKYYVLLSELQLKVKSKKIIVIYCILIVIGVLIVIGGYYLDESSIARNDGMAILAEIAFHGVWWWQGCFLEIG